MSKTDTATQQSGFKELEKRFNIGFPTVLSIDEVEGPLFDYIAREDIEIKYALQVQGYKGKNSSERYSENFSGRMGKRHSMAHEFKIATYSAHSNIHIVLAKGIKFEHLAGADSIEEFVENFPSGRERLHVIDKVRALVREYFGIRQYVDNQ